MKITWLISRLCLLLATAVVTGCTTTLGSHDTDALSRIDFGPEETLQLCMLVEDENMSTVKADQLIDAINKEFERYGISVSVPWYKTWEQPGQHTQWLIEKLAELKLPYPCDRMMLLVGQRSGSGPGQYGQVILGEVDTVTHTRGYVVLKIDSVSNLFVTTQEVIVHESYHLLGCEHDMNMKVCYERIQRLKLAARQNQLNGRRFFPTYSSHGYLIFDRREVDSREDAALNTHRAKASNTN